MARPRKPVMRPPVRKLMRFGARLEKSLEGETTLAPIFTLSVATRRATRASIAAKGWWNLPNSVMGDQMGSPKMVTEAEVQAIPMKE